MHLGTARSYIWWGGRERSKGWIMDLLSHSSLWFPKNWTVVPYRLCTISFKTHPTGIYLLLLMFHMETWELCVELYIKRWVFRLKHPIFALVQTQIIWWPDNSWLWLVLMKEFVVILTHKCGGDLEWCSVKTVPFPPYRLSFISSFIFLYASRIPPSA